MGGRAGQAFETARAQRAGLKGVRLSIQLRKAMSDFFTKTRLKICAHKHGKLYIIDNLSIIKAWHNTCFKIGSMRITVAYMQ